MFTVVLVASLPCHFLCWPDRVRERARPSLFSFMHIYIQNLKKNKNAKRNIVHWRKTETCLWSMKLQFSRFISYLLQRIQHFIYLKWNKNRLCEWFFSAARSCCSISSACSSGWIVSLFLLYGRDEERFCVCIKHFYWFNVCKMLCCMFF